WYPMVPNGQIYALGIDRGSVFAAGLFSGLAARWRSNLAALSATTGQALDWDPNVRLPYSDGGVYALAARSDMLFVGGRFASVGGQPRNNLAAFDANGNLAPWDPSASGAVHALVVGGTSVYAGGEFGYVGGQARIHIAQIDAASGAVSAWAPQLGDTVRALAVQGNTVYAGG